MKKLFCLLLFVMPFILKAQTKDSFTVVNFSYKNADTAYSTIMHRGGGLFHMLVSAKKLKPLPVGLKIEITMPEYYKGWFMIYKGVRYNFLRQEISTK